MISQIPTEEEEQKAFVQYLSLRGFKYFHVPNSTYTVSWKQKARNHALGVVRGVPDMFVITRRGMIAIEMKRTKDGVVSLEQKVWIEALNTAGIPAYVARGCEEAIEIVEGRKS